MDIQVIGAGFGRTGTLSLKFALEKLGFDKCYHMMEVALNAGHAQAWIDCAAGRMPDWRVFLQGYQATVDWPSCNYWREQLQAFPQAKVLLSTRDPQAWHKSVMNTIWPSSRANGRKDDARSQLGWKMACDVIWNGVFDGRVEDKDHAIACFERHNQQVIDEVPAPQLLVYEPGQGWEPICEFLGVPVPDEPYPNTNSTAEFQEFWRKQDEAARNKAAGKTA